MAAWCGLCILEQGVEGVDMEGHPDGSQRPGGRGRAFTQVPWHGTLEPE